MSSRKRNITRKASSLFCHRNAYCFRTLSQSYKFWKNYLKYHPIPQEGFDELAEKNVNNYFEERLVDNSKNTDA